MGIFAKRWPVTDGRGDALALVAHGRSLELRRCGSVEFSYEDPRAEFAEAWGNKDFYVRDGQRKRVTRVRLYDLQKAGGTRMIEFRSTIDGNSFRRWLERHANSGR